MLQQGAALYEVTKHPQLKATLEKVVKELAANQTEDGYLGAWPIPFKQGAINSATPHDVWGHQQVAVGLLEVATATGSEAADTALEKLMAMLARLSFLFSLRSSVV